MPPEAPFGLCPRCVLAASLTPLERPSDAEVAEADRTASVPPVDSAKKGSFGDYELLEEIGRGGMGIVYKARQRSLNRMVALKMVIPSRLTSTADLRRFQFEAETAGRLDHPHILPIYDVGEVSGQPFYTMKWVEGGSLAVAAVGRQRAEDGGRKTDTSDDQGPASARERQATATNLLVKIARAVAYAHERGLLHRDLKPGNILLDAHGEPYVADFGLAKLMEKDQDLVQSMPTVGTPGYAAPEQLQGGSQHATMAADVCSLGAVLYELLTGKAPFRGPTPIEMIRQALDSAVKPPRTLNPAVDRDLETICLKCLQREPKRRYPSAAALAEDLEHWLASEPIQARPVSWVERGWLWCRRKPALASLAGALAFTVIVGSALAGWRIAAARQQERQARERERLETYASSIALADRYIKDGSIDRALNLLYNCPPEFRHWEWGHLLYLCHQDFLSIPAHTKRPVSTWESRCSVSMAFDPAGSRLVTHGAEGRVKVWNVADGKELFGVGDATNRVTSWAVHPQSTELAVGMTNGEIRLFDTTTWQERPTFAAVRVPRHPTTSPSEKEGDFSRALAHPESPTEWVTSVAYDPFGWRLAATMSSGRVRVWDLQSRRQLLAASGEPVPIERPYGVPVPGVWFTPDGRQLVMQSQFAVRRLDAETGEKVFFFQLDPDKDWAVFADPTGQHLATISLQNRVALWTNDRRTHELGFLKTAQPVQRRAFFSPDGRLVCTGGDQSTAQLYEVETGRKLFAIPARIHQVAFSPDGKRLVATGGERVARIWDVAEQEVLLTLRGHLWMAEAAAFSPDGRLIAIAGQDGVVKIWSSSPGRERYPLGRWTWAGAYSPDGKRLSAGGWWEHLKIWDAESGRPEVELKSLCHSALSAAFSPDGTQIVTVGTEKVARIWDAMSGDLVRVLRGHTRSVTAVAWSRDGRRIATSDLDGVVKVWDAATGQDRHTLHAGLALGLGFDSTGRRLATADGLGPPRVWDVESGTLRLTLTEGSAGCWAVRFSPDGSQVIAVGEDRRLRIWDARSGRLRYDWQCRTFGSSSIGCSPDGRRVAVPVSDFSYSGFDVGMFEIWDLQHGRSLLDLSNHAESPFTAEFSPDGRRLLTTSADFAARQEESFPWLEGDYDSFKGATFPERVRAYARQYWRERLAVEAKAALNPRPRRSSIDPDRTLFQPRNPQAGTNLIDLTPHYTGMLDAIFYPTGNVEEHDDDLEALKTQTGFVTLGKGPFGFDVRGVVMLWRVEPAGTAFQGMWDRYPKRVTGVTVGRPVQRLQVLHGVWSQTRIQDGKAIGSFVWHFADGSHRETEILYGRDVRNWCQGGNSPDLQRECERGRVVWEGANPVANMKGETRRLYLTPYENPQPDIEVTSLDFVSKGTQAAPFLVAITVEP